MTDTQAKNIYFLGIGGIGMSAIARYYLLEGVRVGGYDRTETALTRALASEGADIHYEDDPARIAAPFRNPDDTLVVYTPAIPHDHAETAWFRSRGFRMLKRSEILGVLAADKYVMAVAGTHGKTTTTTLISKFYEAAGRRVHLGGNIGAALLPMLPEVSPDDVAVVELSSFQLISMHQSPDIAVVTNVTPNHLDHHKDMQEYIDAKRNILLYQKQPCRAVLGYENEISRSMQKDCKGTQVWFTRLHETDNGAFLRDDGMLCMAENGVVPPFLAQKDVKLRGLHNIENLLAAAAAVWGEVPVEAIRLVGSSFTGVEHRIEPVRVLDGVTYYNDSIGTSPTRTIAGLRSFDQKVILIAGGYDKHIPYEPLAPEITAHVKNLVLMGATGPRIEKAVREDPNFNEAELPIQHADNMQHAVELARACAKPGDIIILSPASASFDLYPNFEVRGREFKSIVNALK